MHLRFVGEFELDERARSLRRRGRDVVIEPKPFDLIVYLLRHRHRVVSKVELHEHLWPGVFVSDAALAQCVARARRAFGADQRIIRTVHGRGFRLVAEIVGDAEMADLGESRRPPRLAGMFGPLSIGGPFPFVGRSAELRRLQVAWEQAVRGAPQTVLLGGEPGIGKSRLAAELIAQVASGHGVVLTGCCDDDIDVPYQPFAEALREYTDACPAERLRREVGPEVVRLLPYLVGRCADFSPVSTGDTESERYRLFAVVVDWLRAAAQSAPMLLVLENLHRATLHTAALLRYVVASLMGSAERVPLLLIVTYRDGELAAADPFAGVLADLRAMSRVQSLSLGGLSAEDIATMVASASGRETREEAMVLAQAVRARTRGNPLFAGELLRHLAQQNGLVTDAFGSYDVAALGAPSSVRALIRKRIARLSPGAREVLPVASVVGYHFDLLVLTHLCAVRDDELFVALAEATAVRIIEEVAPGTYRFAHAVVRQAIAEEVGEARAAYLHRRTAEIIEATYAGNLDGHLADLAFHYGRAVTAGSTAKAVEYATRAGDYAAAALAHDQAVTYYRQALSAAGDSADGRAQRLELLLKLGEAERDTGIVAFRDTLLEAAAEAATLGDARALIHAALANSRGFASEFGHVDTDRVAVLRAALAAVGHSDSAERARLLANLASELVFAGDAAEPTRLIDAALAVARRVGDPATLVHVLQRRYLTAWSPESFPQRLATVRELRAATEQLDDPVQHYWVQVQRMTVALEAGDLAELDRGLAAFAEINRRLGNPALRWALVRLQALRALIAGRLDEAEQLCAEAFALGTSTGQPDASMFYQYQLWGIRAAQGRLGEVEALATALLATYPTVPSFRAVVADLKCALGRKAYARALLRRDAERAFADIPRDAAWLTSMVHYTRVAARLSERAAAAVLYDQLVPFHDRVESSGGVLNGSIALYLGMLATTLRRYDAAEAYFTEAETVHRRLDAPLWLAMTRAEHARMLCRRRGNGDTARAEHLRHEARVGCRGQAFETLIEQRCAEP